MNKRFFKAVLSCALVGALTGCGSSAGTSSSSSKDTSSISGTFEGSSTGMQGTVTVSMTVDAGKITAVDVTESHETESVAGVAMARIPQEMVDHQTTEVDTVTGATFASNALMGAASKAAEAAGLDKDTLAANAYHAAAGSDEAYTADVLVIGGGGAGLSAAITAGQNGSSVILVEKSSFLGGNTMMAGGAYNAVDPDAQAETILSAAQKNTLDSYMALSADDEALHLDQFPEWKEVLTQLQSDITDYYAANTATTAGVDMPGFDSVSLHMWHIYTGGLRQMNDGTWIASNLSLAKTLAESALDTYNWVGSLGVTTQSGTGAGASLYTVLGAMWPRTHAFMNGKSLIDVLEKAATDAGVTIYTETSATALTQDESGKITGAECEKADGTKVAITSNNGVILASGGYCANPKMVKEYDDYWGDDLTDTTLTTNVGTNTGDGIVMAQAVNADTTGLEVAQMMPSSSPVKGTMTDGVWGDASEQIWIDGSCQRFVDEYAERDVLAKASLKLDNGIFYIVYAGSSKDTGKCEGASTDTVFIGGKTIQQMSDEGSIWMASNLKDLAEATNTAAAGQTPSFTEEQLRTLIETYNSYVENQEDPDFGKEVLAGYIDLDAIENDPDAYICISPRKSSLHHTMGGVTINTDAEVLDTDGNAIAGLWAAGEVTGGIHAGNRLGGNAVADIFTFGHIAGANASKAN